MIRKHLIKRKKHTRQELHRQQPENKTDEKPEFEETY